MTAQVINLSKSVARTMNDLRASIRWYKANNSTGIYDRALIKEENMLKRYFSAVTDPDIDSVEAA